MAVESVWGKPAGQAWADDVDEQEHAGTLAAPTPLAMKEEAFPSLAVAAKEVPKKKGKAKPLPLGAFLGGPASNRAAMDDKAILLNLPKGSSGAPREEREGGALGGAFRDYGGDRGGGACAMYLHMHALFRDQAWTRGLGASRAAAMLEPLGRFSPALRLWPLPDPAIKS
jgi:hypothetical protein